MPNVLNRAAGEAVSALSRRAFLRTTASAGIATAAAGGALALQASDALATDLETADAALTAKLEAAMADFLVEAREIKRLEDAYDVAFENVGEAPRPTPKEYWDSRKSALFEPWTIAKHGDGSFTVPADKPLTGRARRKVRLETIAGMRKAIAVRRHWQEAKRAVGVDTLEDAIHACSDRMNAQRDRLEVLAVGISPASIAVLALFEYRFSRDEDFPLTMLKRTAPHLTGLLRVVVDDMIARGATHVNATIFEGGAEARV